MKALVAATLLALSVISAAAQTKKTNKCILTIEQSPEVRGLKLDQPYKEITAGGIGFSYDVPDSKPIGLRKTYFSPSRESELLKGVANLQLNYLDDKLANFQVSYQPGIEWESNAHFASAIAAQLKLPLVGWENNPRGPRLTCDGFFIQIGRVSLGGTLTISRSDFDEEVATRRESYEQKKRVEFKP
jgi:hypothetical protein